MRRNKIGMLAPGLRTTAAVMVSALLLTSPAQAVIKCVPPDAAPAVIVSDTLDLLSLNIAHGRGDALNQLLVSAAGHRRNLGAIATVLEKSGAHVAALQEADGPSLWSGGFDHVQFLAGTTDFCDSVHGHHADSWLFSYGAALLSRGTLTQAWSHSFSPSWPTAGKGFVAGTLAWQQPGTSSPARQVTLVSVHLDFSRESVRKSQIAEIISALDEVSTPMVIMGDFNAVWSATDSPVRKLARDLGLQAFEPDKPNLGTYRENDRLDWILISPELRFANYTVMQDIVSDHLAVVARISWKNPRGTMTDE